MLREKAQAAKTARLKVPMHRSGSDCSIVVMKRGNARGAKGVGHRHCFGSTGNGRNPMFNGRRQPSRDGTSRMTRECLVSRVSPVQTALRNCTGDEGGPFEVGNQVLISSHRKLLLSKAMVVNVAETSGLDSGRQG